MGMSQYGALAMADNGALYPDILAHYYGGLRPQPASGWLPEQILVGLVIGAGDLTVSAVGGASVLVDGAEIAPAEMAVWRFERSGATLAAAVPTGLGTRPEVVDPRLTRDVDGYLFGFDVSAPALLKVELMAGSERVGGIDVGLVEAGEFEFTLRDLLDRTLDSRRTMRIWITTTAPRGGDRASLTIVPAAR